MGVTKIRNRLNSAGNVTIAGDAGWTRPSANIIASISGDTIRVTSGTIQFGSDVSLVRSAANTLSLASGDALDLSGRGLYVPATNEANGTSNLDTSQNGDFRIGHTNGTLQIGFVMNGTAYSISATSGGTCVLVAHS